MNDRIIPNITIKETKIYRASFDRYSSSDQGNVFLNFTNVRDDRGNLIKEHFAVSASTAAKLMDELLPEQEVSFLAEMVIGTDYPDGFEFRQVSFIAS